MFAFSSTIITGVVCGLLLGGLVCEVMPAHILMFLAVVALMLTGVLTPEQAFSGFSNKEMLTVAILYVVVAGFHSTGLTGRLADMTLGSSVKVRWALVRMMIIVTIVSIFFNNTPIVAILAPAVFDWCRRRGTSPSKFLMPLSYAAIFGGMCSLIGTSTNLVISGLMERAQIGGMSFFEIGYIGIPAAILGIFYMATIGWQFLPERKNPMDEMQEKPGEFMATVCLGEKSSLAGKTVEEAHLRNLPGLFLVKIVRSDTLIAPVKASEKLHSQDVLYFSGDIAMVDYIFNITGSTSAPGACPTDMSVHLLEALIPPTSSLVGDTLKNSRFRSRYDGAVIALYRNGFRLEGKLGEQRLRGGDVLLLMAGVDFSKNIQNNDIILISEQSSDKVADEAIPAWKKAAPCFILSSMIISVVFGYTSMFYAAAAAASVTLLFHLVKPHEVLQHIEWSVLIVIACSFGVATALEKSGLASVIGQVVVGQLGAYGPMAALFAILVATCIVTEFLTNNAAAALMFPLAMAIAQLLGTDPRPFAIAVAIGASAGYAMPFGYQTHLMVYGPGSYRLRDFLTVGIPLDILYIAAGTLLVPLIWKL